MASVYLHADLYVSEETGGVKPIRGVSVSTGSIVGIFERGAVGEAVLVTSVPEFITKYGSPPFGYYSWYSAIAFFNNGGNRLYVVRTVHYSEGSPTCVRANYTVPDQGVANTLLVQAKNCGEWGNRIEVEFANSNLCSSKFSAVCAAGSLQATLKSVSGLAVGSVVQLGAGEYIEYRILTGLEKAIKTVSWADGTGSGQGVTLYSHVVGDTFLSLEFDIDVYYVGARKKSWTYLSMSDVAPHFCENVVNDVDLGSEFIEVTDQDSTTAIPNDRPNTGTRYMLVGGTDGLVGLVQNDFTGLSTVPAGMHALDVVRLPLMLVIPDIHQCTDPQDSINNLLNYGDSNGRVFSISSVPYARTAQTAVTFVEDTGNFSSSFGAIYWPWVKHMDINGVKRWIPADGYLMGLYARTDNERGIHKAPAGTGAVLRGIYDVEVEITEAMQDVVYPSRINPIIAEPGYGITAWGCRTLSSDSEYRQVNVRRWLIYCRESLVKGLRWTVFEPNDATLWSRITTNVANFLSMEWKKGALMGAKVENSFYVKCNEDNNTLVSIGALEVNCEVGVNVTKAGEFIIITIKQTPDAAASSEG